MAQTGYTPIQLYYSTTASAVPTNTNLANGELAINITDGKLYYKNNSGTVTVLAGAGGTGIVAGSNTQVQFNNNGVFGGAANMLYTPSALSLAQNLLFTDNTYDIGASGATRPRNAFLGTNLTVGNNITVGTASGSEYIYKSGTDTATGLLRIQAGAGSAAYGGGLVLYSHSNATNPGWVVAGLSTGAAAKFAVNTWGIGGGTDVFTVDPAGLGYFASNVAIGTTPAGWTGAYALQVANYTAYGQRSSGNSDLVTSWNAQWSGISSGAGYTYRVTGDVASAYEQNGAHRFYTTPTVGTAGGGISFPVRLAISAAGYTYVNYQGAALANLNILTNGAGGGIQLNRNASGNPTIGESFGQYAWKGVDSANTNNAAEAMIEAYATENHTGSTAGTGIIFYTKQSGVGPGSAPSVAGGINAAQQWALGSTGPDNLSRLTLWGPAGQSNALSIYETSSGNNARLRLYQASGAVYYDATYGSGTNSHNFQVGSTTYAAIDPTRLTVQSGEVNVTGSGSRGVRLRGLGNGEVAIAGDGTTYATGFAFYNTTSYATTHGGMFNYVAGGTNQYIAIGTAYNNAGIYVSANNSVSINTTAQEGKLTVAYGNEASGQAQIAQFRTEATGSATYNTGVQIYGTASATAADRSVVLVLDADGANASGGDYLVLQKIGNSGNANLTNASNASLYLGTNATQTIRLYGANSLQQQGFSASAYGDSSTMQEWVGVVNDIANGASFGLFYINQIYDNLCYELSMFCNAGGFFAYKSAGIIGYNGFVNTVLGASISQTITRTGALFNETMTITNNGGGTINQYVICLRVFGLANKQNIGIGGDNAIVSSYLTRRH